MYKESPEKALEIADEIIKNTYKTLMTRAMKGCHIYCTNIGLSKYLKEKLNETMESLKHKYIEVNILA